MISKKILILSACLYLELAFADLEKLEHRSKCRSKTILCPCMDENGTVRFSEQIMSADNYPSIFSRQMAAIVYLYLSNLFARAPLV